LTISDVIGAECDCALAGVPIGDIPAFWQLKKSSEELEVKSPTEGIRCDGKVITNCHRSGMIDGAGNTIPIRSVCE
jgi:hypothetical protein